MFGETNPLHLHLSRFVKLSAEERELLDRAVSQRVRQLGPRQDIIREGESPRVVNVLLTGWAFRYKDLPDGRRQILSFFIPGDLCDASVYVLNQMDHSVGTLTDVTFAEITPDEFEKLMNFSTNICKALWWSELVTVAIQREWTASIGQRTALERLAHMFCEIMVRLAQLGIETEERFLFPLTQIDIADAMGMTPVHANRTLQTMRREGLIEFSSKMLKVKEPEKLAELGHFNPNYLHLEQVRLDMGPQDIPLV